MVSGVEEPGKQQHKHLAMTNNPPPLWVDVNEAAALVGKSISTIRRLLPDIEENTPDAIRREPIEGKGGEKVLLFRAYLIERFGGKEPEGLGRSTQTSEEPEPGGFAALVEILERQLEAKDRQLAALQRDAENRSRQIDVAQRSASDLAESLRQFAALNAALQSKVMALTERAGEPTKQPESGLNGPGYWVAVSVASSLALGLLIWLFLQWVGNE